MIMAMRIANAIFALLFVFAAVVQYNDPDPLLWIAAYTAAAAACVAWEFGRAPRWVPGVLAVVTLGWAGLIAAGIRLDAPFGEALTDWQMHAGGSEELREALGLVLVAAWMTALALVPRRTGHR